MSQEPKNGDFASLVTQAGPPNAQQHVQHVQPVATWEERWESVLAFVSQQRFRLLGLMATTTVAVVAALLFLVALVIKVESPVSDFALNVVVQSPFSQVVLQGVHGFYQTPVIEAAEAFQATGKAPPGVNVVQNGPFTEVDGRSIKALMPLNEAMLGTAAVALAFAVAASLIFQQLKAVAPSAVTTRRLWLTTGVLIWLEVWAYSLQGVWGLSVLLFAVGGVSAGLLLLLRHWSRKAASKR